MFTTETLAGESFATWRSPNAPGAGLGVSFTALWYHIVALPILQFFLYRWLWRLFVWAVFLATVSRLELDLVASHADQAGGLGFLGTAHSSLAIFAMAWTAVLSAEVAFLIVFKSADYEEKLAALEGFKIPFIAFLAIVELIVFGPLLVFIPILTRTRLAWLRSYSLLVVRYNRAFHENWIDGKAPADEPLLGSADIQSLNDLGGCFEYIRNMKVIPFSLRAAIQLAIASSVPCLPLLLLVMPLGKIVDLLAGAVLSK
jgi:hypothetical protein